MVTSLTSRRATPKWSVHREPAVGRGGMVAAKMPQAVDAGLAMLAKSGNAIDAAVATAFAIGVVEPPMNGLGGGGYMVVWLEKEQKAIHIDYPMISGSLSTPEMFPLQAAALADTSLFGWPTTIDNANVVGYRSIAVPGTLAGLTMALERYGTLSLAEVIEPAIVLAEEGYPVNWHQTVFTARDLPTIQPFAATAEIFLTASGHPPATTDQTNPAIIRQADLAKTLRAIADNGPRELYEGELGRSIARHLNENGSAVTEDDFAAYQAIEREPLTIDYHGHQVHTVGGGTGGTSMAEALMMLNELDTGNPARRSATDLHRMAQAFQQAFADRFAYLADPDLVEVPLDALLDPAYARERAAGFDAQRAAPPQAGLRTRLGVTHDMPASVPDYVRSGSTTHLSTMDAEGNAVAITQTLLALWGSRVTVPGTGILMNNGMMWFDPEPGRPNSVAPGKRPLSNMAPAVVTRNGRSLAAIGSSGGRRIQNCNAQVIMNIVDGGMGAQEAISTPRIDASTTALAISSRFPGEVLRELEAMGHKVSPRDETLLTSDFASPVGIRRREDGTFDGGADPYYFAATAEALDPE